MATPLAGHTNSYHTYSHDEALEGIAEAGYKAVELSAVPGWTEHVDLDADQGNRRRQQECGSDRDDAAPLAVHRSGPFDGSRTHMKLRVLSQDRGLELA